MQITFIGTGSGKTCLKRYHSSLLFESSNSNLLIDTGDGISRALLAQNISFNSIDNILISHYHADHFAGLPGLITQMKLDRRTKALTIFAHSELVETLWNILNAHYLFIEKMDFDLQVKPFEDDEELMITESLSFRSFMNSHVALPTFHDRYVNISFKSFSFLLSIDTESILYSADIGSVNDLIPHAQLKPNILITETTHVTIEDLNMLLQKFKPQKMVLTHIDDSVKANLKLWSKSHSPQTDTEIIIASDGLIIN